MSISSMTNVAFARRTDTPGGAPATAGQIASKKGDVPATQSVGSSALAAIAAYIPTEVLTVYVAVIAALKDSTSGTGSVGQWLSFWAFLIATPAVVWLLYAGKVRTAKGRLPLNPNRWPVWEMFAATVAYGVWAVALPATPFASLAGYSPALAGVAMLVVSTVLGLMAPVVARPLRP